MAWTPARELDGTTSAEGQYWPQLQAIYDEAIPLEPLPRGDLARLSQHYIDERIRTTVVKLSSAKYSLPKSLQSEPLGLYEADFLDFILHYQQNRVLALTAPRGAGKTSFLHYIEAVVNNSSLENKPIFLIFGVLAAIDGDEDKYQSANDLSTIMAAAVRAIIPASPADFQGALFMLADNLRHASSTTEIRETFREFALRLTAAQRRQIVLIFDNLDHLRFNTIVSILELAKSIYLVSQIACVVCLRPNCLVGLARRGDARAFFSYRIELPSPRVPAWIGYLGRRMRDQAIRRLRADDLPVMIDDQPISPEQLGEVINRFADLLLNRPAQDDVLQLLQAISADDLRHLRILFRRLLAHESFPMIPLLQNAKRIDFHPMPALMEGYQKFYTHNEWIPNLLIWSDTRGNPDFLIFHRILRLLDRLRPESVASIVAMMNIFGYDHDSTLGALEALYGPLLIRGTDKDKFNINSPPAEIYRTRAGHYYTTNLLSNADYLLWAVLDVPLRHDRLKTATERDADRIRDGRFFVERVLSLVEYAEEVAEREVSQVGRLGSMAPSPEVRRAADSLRYGGLFISALCHALDAVADRAWYSRLEHIRAEIKDVAPRLARLRSIEARLQGRLAQIVHRRGRSIPLPETARLESHGPLTLTIQGTGHDLTAQAEMALAHSSSFAVLSLGIEVGGELLWRTTVVRARVGVGLENQTSLRGIGSFDPLVSKREGEIGRVQLRGLLVEQAESGEIFLASEISNGALILKLYLLDSSEPPIALSDPVPLSTISELAERLSGEISGRSMEKKLSVEDIYTVGTRLAYDLLNPSGQNVLATYMRSARRCIILADDLPTPVPFEWIRPVPRFDDAIPNGTLAEHCHVVRFPFHPLQYVVGRTYRTVCTRRLCTIGLPISCDIDWRFSVPTSPGALQEFCRHFGFIHLIGHYKEPDSVYNYGRVVINIGEHSIEMSENSILAFPFCGRDHCVVLSVCDIGSLQKDRNMARMLAERFWSCVWTPVVSISESNVEELDKILGKYVKDCEDDDTLDTFFAQQRQNGGFAHVYVRYGA